MANSKLSRLKKHDCIQGDPETIISAVWNAIDETAYLNQFPRLAENIQKASRESLEDGTLLEDLEW